MANENRDKTVIFLMISVVVAALFAVAATIGVFEMLLFAAFAASFAIVGAMIAVTLNLDHHKQQVLVRVSSREKARGN
jgi:hypothetical protein